MLTCPNCQFPNPVESEACARCGLTRPEGDSAAGALSAHLPAPSLAPLSNPTVDPILSYLPAIPACTPVPSHPNITVSVRGTAAPTVADRPNSDRTPAPVWTTTPPTLAELSPFPSLAPATLRNRPYSLESNAPLHEPVSTRRADSALAPKAEPPPPKLRVWLVVLRGMKIGIEYPIYEGRNTIGRFVDKPVDLDLIAQESVEQTWCSRHHAAVTLAGTTISVEDLNSLNGTWVNGKRIASGQPRVLQPNDVIQVGTVQLKVIVG